MFKHKRALRLLFSAALLVTVCSTISVFLLDPSFSGYSYWQSVFTGASRDPNRLLPLLSSSEYILSKESLLSAIGSTSLTLDSIADFYRRWKFNNTLTYLLPYTLFQNLLARRRFQPSSLDQLFHNSHNESLLRTYSYDPRLTTTVYYDHIASELYHGKQPSELSVPFNWYDWCDLSILNDFIDLPQHEKPTCDLVVHKYFPANQLFDYERKFRHKLFIEDRGKGLVVSNYARVSMFQESEPFVPPHQYCLEEPRNHLLPGFSSVDILNYSRPEIYALQARSYLYSTASSPLSLTFLNKRGPPVQLWTNNSSPLDENGVPQSLLFNGLLQSYLQRNLESYPDFPKKDHSFDNIEKFHKLKSFLYKGYPNPQYDQTSSSSSSSSPDSDKHAGGETTAAPPRIDKRSAEEINLPYTLTLSPEDFEFNAMVKITELESLPSMNDHQRMYLQSIKDSMTTHVADTPKFFREAAYVTDYIHLGHHFDARFFRGALPDKERIARLDAIVRAWLSFTNSNGLISWLAHGTLYGWLYDGLAFPWDGDHDMQMPIVHLHKLAERFNQTLVVEDPTVGNGRYFIDVGNSLTSRIHGNGNNNIDARFIDVDSGLYVDITGLSVSSEGVHPRFNWLVEKYKAEKTDQTPYFKDPNYIENITYLTGEQKLEIERSSGKNVSKEREAFLKKLDRDINSRQFDQKSVKPQDRYNINKHIQAYNCRNNHFQTLFELSPLRLTYFHGIPAYVPNLIIKDLNAEYKVPPPYSFSTFQGTSFVPEVRVWLKNEKVDQIINKDGKFKNVTRLSIDRMQNLTLDEFSVFLHNAAKIPELEDTFVYFSNTFEITLFRQKELGLMYDSSFLSEDKQLLLNEFVRNRTFNGVFKDVFQNKLETTIWYNLLNNMPDSYKSLLESLAEVNLEQANRILSLNQDVANDRYNWTDAAGVQQPRSELDFNTRGEKFFVMGKKWTNEIYKHDPLDKDTDLKEIYHKDDEEKYSKKNK